MQPLDVPSAPEMTRETPEVRAGNLQPQPCGDQYQAVVTISVSRALD